MLGDPVILITFANNPVYPSYTDTSSYQYKVTTKS
jgi:hypothetical protein